MVSPRAASSKIPHKQSSIKRRKLVPNSSLLLLNICFTIMLKIVVLSTISTKLSRDLVLTDLSLITPTFKRFLYSSKSTFMWNAKIESFHVDSTENSIVK